MDISKNHRLETFYAPINRIVAVLHKKTQSSFPPTITSTTVTNNISSDLKAKNSADITTSHYGVVPSNFPTKP